MDIPSVIGATGDPGWAVGTAAGDEKLASPDEAGEAATEGDTAKDNEVDQAFIMVGAGAASASLVAVEEEPSDTDSGTCSGRGPAMRGTPVRSSR